ncbi:MAG: glycosyltransferase family 4 protein [Verrucomicrobiota bacterium]|nr:glycosyltransferase family 4 protein [Verrucomicrobiota bacterium]
MAALTPWYVAQLGAREHYAIPRSLHARSRLGQCYTDLWAGTRCCRMAACIPGMRSLGGRHHRELPDDKVTAWNSASLLRQARARMAGQSSSAYHTFIADGQWFSKKVATAIQRSTVEHALFFSYDTTFLEAARAASERGWKTVVGQMDPGLLEQQLTKEEEQAWHGWTVAPLNVPAAYNERRAMEWASADRIIVNSEWTRDALLAQQVPADKLRVIPLAYDSTYTPLARTMPVSFTQQRPLRVLYLGQVNLRKGIPYLCEAAKCLCREPVRFDIVGPLGITTEAIRKAPNNVHFHGRRDRLDIAALYEQADVFILPTVSDGFAITQLEAMAHGLPVIATTSCADVVIDGVNGQRICPRNVSAICDAVLRYITEPTLLDKHSEGALMRARDYRLNTLADHLVALSAEFN